MCTRVPVIQCMPGLGVERLGAYARVLFLPAEASHLISELVRKVEFLDLIVTTAPVFTEVEVDYAVGYPCAGPYRHGMKGADGPDWWELTRLHDDRIRTKILTNRSPDWELIAAELNLVRSKPGVCDCSCSQRGAGHSVGGARGTAA